jgi:hypothetical protein
MGDPIPPPRWKDGRDMLKAMGFESLGRVYTFEEDRV